MKIVALNPRARNFQILEKFEAGIVLTGAEIKSIRAGRISLSESFGKVKDGECYLVNAYIAPYMGLVRGYDPRRSRKLLLKKPEINFLTGKLNRNLTIVPLRVYIRKNLAKAELALVRGKRKYEQRKEERKREVEARIKFEI